MDENDKAEKYQLGLNCNLEYWNCKCFLGIVRPYLTRWIVSVCVVWLEVVVLADARDEGGDGGVGRLARHFYTLHTVVVLLDH